jgi:hypothetical protein
VSTYPGSAAPPPAEEGSSPPRTGAYLGIATLVLIGTALFATAAIVKVRQPENAPVPKIAGIPAWQVATAGFITTLAGGLWLRRLVK